MRIEIQLRIVGSEQALVQHVVGSELQLQAVVLVQLDGFVDACIELVPAVCAKGVAAYAGERGALHVRDVRIIPEPVNGLRRGRHRQDGVAVSVGVVERFFLCLR